MLGILVYLGVFGLLAAGTIRRPAFGLSAVLCMFVIEQWGQTKVSFVASHASLTNYLGCLIVLLGIACQIWRGERFRLVNGPVHFCVILLYLYSACSLLWTPAPAAAIEEWRHNWPYALLTFALVPMIIQDKEDAREGLSATLIVGTLLAFVFAVFVEYGFRSVVSEIATDEAVRLPGALAELGAYIFIISAMMARRQALNLIVSLGVMALGGLLVMQSGTRGQLLAMIICAGTFMAVSRSTSAAQRNFFLVAGGALSVVAAYFAFTELSQLFTATQGGRWTIEGAESAYGGRMEMAGTLLDHYMSAGLVAMVFGLGTSASFSPEIVGFYPHVVPVEILGELGLVGAGLFLIIVWRTLSLILRVIGTQEAKSSDGRIVAVLAALFVFELLLSLKEGSLLRGLNVFLFSILLESVVAHRSAAINKVARVQPY